METLSALRLAKSSLPICLIPTGTGNIVANDLATPRRILPAVRQAFEPGMLRWWDAGLLPDHKMVFALRASAGFEADVVASMNLAAKKRWGVIAYMIPALRVFMRTSAVQFNITLDDQKPFQMEGVLALVAVTSRITGFANFVISRDIHPDDGVLHLGIFHPRNFLQNLPALVNQAALQARDMISIFPVRRRVLIECDHLQTTQVDGELLGHTPLLVETLPQSAAFITPFVARRRYVRHHPSS
jgi:diacylglycerol kinase family enzyme